MVKEIARRPRWSRVLESSRFDPVTGFELRRQLLHSEHGVVAFLDLDRRDVADRLQQPAIVEAFDLCQRGELDRFARSPATLPPDDLGVVEAVDCLGERLAGGVADAADGWLDAGFRVVSRLMM